MNSIVILILALVPCFAARQRSNNYCGVTWPNTTEYYLYRESKNNVPEPTPKNSLRNKNLFKKKNQQFCRKLNRTLVYGYPKKLNAFDIYDDYGEVRVKEPTLRSYRFPVNFHNIKRVFGKEKDLVTKTFSFSYSLLTGKNTPAFKISTKVPRNTCISSLTRRGKMYKLFPTHYRVTKYYSKHTDERYYLIEGKRCKILYDKNSKKYKKKVCWSHPYFCRGRRAACLLNDDISTFCYDTMTGEGQLKKGSSSIPYSLLIGEMIYWKAPTTNVGKPLSKNDRPMTFTWNCTDFGKTVWCDYLEDGPRPSLKVIKTLSGYAR